MNWIDFRQTINQRTGIEQLDEEQNRARNFSINGHSLVRGVAGSGKSLILRNRVETLLENGFDSILVLTYNRFMKGWTQSTLAGKRGVEVRTFHQCAYPLGYDYKHDKEADFIKRFVERVDNSQKKYQAILVDEAQDFYDEWFQAMLAALDPTTNSLFFAYDNTQSVYGQPHRRKNNWRWTNLNIIVTGRSQIFDLNYRNSPEILELAWKFIQPALEKTNMQVDRREKGHTPTIDKIIEPKKKLSRSSNVPPLLRQISRQEMPLQIARQVKAALESYPHSSIGILIYPRRARALKQEISQALDSFSIAHHAPSSSPDRATNVVNRPYVIVDSWNALKGVEFDAAIVVGVDWSATQTDTDNDSTFEEKAGVYTAMTRARDHLVVLYEEKTLFVEMLETALKSPDQLRSEDAIAPGTGL